jgi:hypothetical protein
MMNNSNKTKTRRGFGICSFIGKVFVLVWLGLAGLGGLVGCKTIKPVCEPLTRMEAMTRYNANIEALPPFKANVFEWEVKFVDDKGKKQKHPHMGGRVYFVPAETPEQPSSFFLMTKAVMGDALVVGSNEKEFWMYIKPDKRGWWGKYEHQGKDCSKQMMIDPQVFLEFIGLRHLPIRPIYPAYKVADDHYTIEYIDYQKDGYQIKREIIIDRCDNLPREINTYNQNGQRTMHSRLSNYKKLGEAWVPGEIQIATAIQDFRFRLKLWGFKAIKKDDRKLSRILQRPRRISGIDDYQQVDKDCEGSKE